MILRFSAEATQADRDAVEAALAALGRRVTPRNGTLVVEPLLTGHDAIAVAAMTGVEDLSFQGARLVTVRDVVLDWVAAGALIVGLVTLVAAQFPADLGRPADPMFTPGELPPAWPLLPIYALVERAPDWLPAVFFPVSTFLVVLFWPWIGRGLAQRKPALHTALGVLGLVLAGVLTVLEVLR